MGKFTTITQIANELGVAPSTVSRALKGNPRISKKTQIKVTELATELGYRPNPLSHQLKNGQSMLIGLIVPDITLHFYSSIVESIHSLLMQSGYSIVLFNTRESMKEEKEAVKKLVDLRVDGVIAALASDSTNADHFQELLNLSIPLVFYDRVSNFLPVPKIISDDYKASYDATSYMVASGCRQIAHITASKALNNSNNRLYGYLDALRDHQLPVDDDLVFYSGFSNHKIEKQLDKWLAAYKNLDGIFVFNDYLANVTTNYLLQKGIKVPDQVSVMGFSDEPVATYMTPQLSTVEGVAPRMGKMAVQKLLAVLQGEAELFSEKEIVQQKLILRGTTRTNGKPTLPAHP